MKRQEEPWVTPFHRQVIRRSGAIEITPETAAAWKENLRRRGWRLLWRDANSPMYAGGVAEAWGRGGMEWRFIRRGDYAIVELINRISGRWWWGHLRKRRG